MAKPRYISRIEAPLTYTFLRECECCQEYKRCALLDSGNYRCRVCVSQQGEE